jgi:hypothetical protein
LGAGNSQTSDNAEPSKSKSKEMPKGELQHWVVAEGNSKARPEDRPHRAVADRVSKAMPDEGAAIEDKGRPRLKPKEDHSHQAKILVQEQTPGPSRQPRQKLEESAKPSARQGAEIADRHPEFELGIAGTAVAEQG